MEENKSYFSFLIDNNIGKGLILGLIPTLVTLFIRLIPSILGTIVLSFVDYPLVVAGQIIGRTLIECSEPGFICLTYIPKWEGVFLISSYFLIAGLLSGLCVFVLFKKRTMWLISIIAFILFLIPLYAYPIIVLPTNMTNDSSPLECSLLRDGPDQTPQSWCYHFLAEKKLDANLCKKVKDKSIREECYEPIALLKLDSSICLMLDSELKEKCLFRTFMRKVGNPTLEECNSITNTDYRDSCFMTVFNSDLRGQKSPVICNIINRLSTKRDCLITVAKLTSNLSICLSLPNDDVLTASSSQNSCFSKIAEYNNAPDVCSNIKHDYSKEYCIKRIDFLRANPDTALKALNSISYPKK